MEECGMAVPDDFRRFALSLPGAIESAHMGHPDFRVSGRIFATLQYPTEAFGMVALDPAQQREFILSEPDAFLPVKGAWGVKGATNVRLGRVTMDGLQRAIETAWNSKRSLKPSKKRARSKPAG
jgi:hypothetical protein